MTRPHRKGGPSHISDCLAALMDEIEAGVICRAKPRLTHADRPGSAAGPKVVVSHDGPPGAVTGYEFTGSRKDGEK